MHPVRVFTNLDFNDPSYRNRHASITVPVNKYLFAQFAWDTDLRWLRALKL